MLARFRGWRDDRRFLRNVLDAANEIRAARDLPPLKRLPKGERGNGSMTCPLAVAFGPLPLPDVCKVFVARFDRGDLPNLVA